MQEERPLDPKKDSKELTERQNNILNSIKTNKSLTRAQLAQRLGVSDSTIKREIAILRNKGYLGRESGNTYGTWLILKEFE